MDLRLTFNEDPINYDRFRPTYPTELSTQVIEFSKLTEHSHVVEIGIGAGQATLPFLKTNCKIKAIELGDKLAEFVSGKFAGYDKFEVVNQDFEQLELDEDFFDLIYSASAFHWIPLETGVPKVIRMLKAGGVFAWFSVQPMPADEHFDLHKKIQKVYQKYSEYFGDKVVLDPEEMKIQMIIRKDNRENIFREYEFSDIRSSMFYGSKTFTGEEYVKLISTYSDHKAVLEEKRIVFLELIKQVINDNGGYFKMDYTYILCMGRK